MIFNRILICFSLLTLTAAGLDLRHFNHKHVKKLRKIEGALNLVGGSGDSQGNVEILHDGIWGSICDDEWDDTEATLVCNQLGFEYGRATTNSQFGPARRQFWMDDLLCDGTEDELSNCRFSGWGQTDCLASEAAGVICHSAAKNEILNDADDLLIDEFSNENLVPLKAIQGLRLKHGSSRQEGLVQLQFPNGKWHMVCSDGWSILEAMVVCRQLNLGYANEALHSNRLAENLTGYSLSGIKCMGNENFLQNCYHDRARTGKCNGRSAAGVLCVTHMADLELDYHELIDTAYVDQRPLSHLQCAMEENCLASEAYEIQKNYKRWTYFSRSLLRFTTKVKNIGTADFRPSLPKNLWEWHMCHKHYHSMEIFAIFDIYDLNGRKMAEGHKASFCLEDNQCDDRMLPNYRCANFGDQGISVNCTDIYKHTIDCQWIDITSLQANNYILKIVINPEFKIPEITFENNAAICKLFYDGKNAFIENCSITRP